MTITATKATKKGPFGPFFLPKVMISYPNRPRRPYSVEIQPSPYRGSQISQSGADGHPERDYGGFYAAMVPGKLATLTDNTTNTFTILAILDPIKDHGGNGSHSFLAFSSSFVVNYLR